jgi:amidase
VVAGPVEGEDAAWRLDLPAARHDRLDGFRVAVMPPLELVQPSAAMQGRVDELATWLARRGAVVAGAMPDVNHEGYFRDYLTLLTVMTSQGKTRQAREATARRLADGGGRIREAMAAGMTLDADGYLALLRRREAARAAWRAFFRDWDVLVCPTALDAAFPHQVGDQHERTLAIDDRAVPYLLNIVYPMWAIFAGQPATAFPAGQDGAGLPLGLQAIGPYLEDRTTLRFAQLLEREWYAFERPPL